jgi:hypothetical protein
MDGIQGKKEKKGTMTELDIKENLLGMAIGGT